MTADGGNYIFDLRLHNWTASTNYTLFPRGHVARDISPYSCIFDNCSIPDEMYVTSNALMQHFRTEHGVRCWICDHCSMQTSDPASFIFKTFDEWATHMSNFHHDIFSKIQPIALSEICTRVMLPPVSCPLCGYSTCHPSAVLDEHVTQHLHNFALNSLPWGLKHNGKDDDSFSDKAGEPQSTSKTDISMLSPGESSTLSQTLLDARNNRLSHMKGEPQSLTKTKVAMLSHEENNTALRNWLDACDNLLSHLTEDPQSTTKTHLSLLPDEEGNTMSLVRKVHLDNSELS